MAGDEDFLDQVSAELATLPGVSAVGLGGSRAQGTHRADSDWDLGIYYRNSFDPQQLRDIGWPGQVFELGAWGGGIFNGGAWLEIDGRRVGYFVASCPALLTLSGSGRRRRQRGGTTPTCCSGTPRRTAHRTSASRRAPGWWLKRPPWLLMRSWPPRAVG